MSVFHFDGIDFYFEDDDNGGVPFIFLHGLGGDTTQTMGVMKERLGIRRIALDFRGHGQTICTGGIHKISFNQFAEDVLALANHLGLDTFMLGGISTGAGVALNLVLHHPSRVTKLVLSRPAWKDGPQEPDIVEAFQKIYDILADDSIEDKKEAYRQTEMYQKMNQLAHYAGETLLGQFDYPYAKETADKLRLIPRDCPNKNREEWHTIEVPVLILASKQDPIHPFEYGVLLSQTIQKAVFKELTPKEVSGVRHNQDSYKCISEFL